MTDLLPILVDLAGRRVVVVGGGVMAEAKVSDLIPTGAEIVVVAPTLSHRLIHDRDAGHIQHVSRLYREGDLQGSCLAFAATDDPAVHSAIRREGAERNVLVNCVDDRACCDFLAPAVMRRGDLVIAVSTGGGSPVLAQRVRDRIGDAVGSEWGDLLTLLAQLRPEVTRRVHPLEARRELWNRLLDSEAIDRLRVGDFAGARRVVRREVEAAAAAAVFERGTVVGPTQEEVAP